MSYIKLEFHKKSYMAGFLMDGHILKIQSEEWEGRWINVCEGDIIPDKAVLQAVIRPAKVCI